MAFSFLGANSRLFADQTPPTNFALVSLGTGSIATSWDLITGNSYTMAISTDSAFMVSASSGRGSVNQNTTGYVTLRANSTYYFKVKISTDPDSAYSAVLATCTYVITTVGLVPNTSYYFRTLAYGRAGSLSDYNAAATTTTLAAVPSPLAFIAADVASDFIKFSWAPNNNPADTFYQANISTSSDFVVFSTSETESMVSITSQTLTQGSLYHFRVRARNRRNIFTDWSVAVTTKTAGDVQAPGAISDLTALSGPTESAIQLAWTSPGNDGALGQIDSGIYRIKYSTTQISNFDIPPPLTTAVDITTTTLPNSRQGYVVAGLNPGTTYFFAMETNDLTNWSIWSTAGVNTLNSSPALDLPLPAPSAAAVVASSETSLKLEWTLPAPSPIDDRSQYKVYRATYNFTSSSQPAVTLSATLTHPATSFTDGALNAGVTYFFKLTSIDSATVTAGLYSIPLESALSNVAGATTPFTAPSNLANAVLSTTSIKWTWADNSFAESGYRVYSSSNGLMSGNLPANTTSWLETALTPNSLQGRFVRGFNSVLESVRSSIVSTYTFAVIPGTPTLKNPSPLSLDFTIDTAAPNGVYLTSTKFAIAISSDNFASTTFYVRYPDGFMDATESWQTVPNWNNDLSIFNLTPSTTYFIKVKARNLNLVETVFGPTASSTTLAAEFNFPDAISDLTALTGNLDGEAVLQWTSPGDDAGVGPLNQGQYRVLWSTSPIGYFSSTQTFNVSFTTTGVAAGSDVGYAVEGLNPGTSYYFAVIARDDSGNWATWKQTPLYNNANNAWAQDLVLPAPTTLSVLFTDEGSASLGWTPPPSPLFVDDRAFYKVYRATYSFAALSDPAVTLSTTVRHAATSYMDSSLSAYVTYYFRVLAVDSGTVNGLYSQPLESALSAAVSTATLLNAPTGFAAVNVSSSSIVWSWSDNSKQEMAYQVISTNAVQISPVLPPDTTFWMEPNLSPNVLYARFVRAVSVTGNTVASAPINKYTLAAPPGILPYSNLTNTTLTAGWSSQGNPLYTGYTLELDKQVSFPNPIYSIRLSGINEFTFPNLESNTTYFVRVKGTNQESVDTVWTVLGPTATYASTLPAPTLMNPATGSIDASIEFGDNPPLTELAISVSLNSFASQSFVQADGTLAPSEFFQSKLAWNGGTVTVSGLSPNLNYAFRIQARNASGITTQFSPTAAKITLAVVPMPPTLSQEFDGTLGNHIHVGIPSDGNSAATQYSIQYFDQGLWIQGDGTVSASQVWKTAAQWIALHPTNSQAGLVGGTSYSYLLQARNGDGITTALSSVTTLLAALLGDINAPVVVSVLPAETTVTVLPNAAVSLTYNEALIAAVVQGKVTLAGIRDNSANIISSAVPGIVSVSSNILTFTSSVSLQKCYLYEVTVASGIQDLAGNLTAAAKVWTFRTACDPGLVNIVEVAGSRIRFDAGAFPEDYGVAATNPQVIARETNPSAVSHAIAKGTGGGSVPSYLVPGAIVEINIYAAASGGRMAVPHAPTTLSISYPDADDDGYIDGLKFPIRTENLDLYYLDEASESFVKLPGSVTDTAQKCVRVTLPHFSVFAIMGSPSTSLTNAHAFPVPFVPSKGDTHITFTDLSGVALIRIYSVSGELLQTLEESDGDGFYVWDAKSADGNDLGSGVYLYHIESATDEKKGKIIIVR